MLDDHDAPPHAAQGDIHCLAPSEQLRSDIGPLPSTMYYSRMDEIVAGPLALAMRKAL